jgi:hypothetical protein
MAQNLSRALTGWGQADFLKTSAPLSFNKYRPNEPILAAVSISQDITFVKEGHCLY